MTHWLALALSSLLAVIVAAPAYAHGLAGKRFFPSTIAIEDPFVSDKLTLSTTVIVFSGLAGGSQTFVATTKGGGEIIASATANCLVTPGSARGVNDPGNGHAVTCPDIRRVSSSANTTPAARPTPASDKALLSTMLKTCERLAPNAMRIPISLVRCTTEYDITP